MPLSHNEEFADPNADTVFVSVFQCMFIYSDKIGQNKDTPKAR